MQQIYFNQNYEREVRITNIFPLKRYSLNTISVEWAVQLHMWIYIYTFIIYSFYMVKKWKVTALKAP